jgi:hypothetical protein
MLIFVLRFDKSVVVEELATIDPTYISYTLPAGQLFAQGINSWDMGGWHCIHRGIPSAWRIATKVPAEVKMAALIVN